MLKKSINVLVVDDDPGVRKPMRRITKPLGYRVITATNGEEGFSIVHRDTIHPVLLDLDIPVIDGPTFIKNLRIEHQDLPVIVVTGYPDSNLMMEAFRFGPLTLISKPIDKCMLLAAVSMPLAGAPAGS